MVINEHIIFSETDLVSIRMAVHGWNVYISRGWTCSFHDFPLLGML